MNKHRRLYFSLSIVIVFILGLLSSQNSSMRWLDAQMFKLSSYLLPLQSSNNNFRIVQLDDGNLQSPEGIYAFRSLLRKLKKSRVAEIVWLTDDFPQMDYQVEVKDEKEKIGDADGDVVQRWQPTEGERNKLAWMLENQDVFLTQYRKIPHSQNLINYTDSLVFNESWRQYIPSLFLPQPQVFRKNNANLPYRVYPFEYESRNLQTYIWYNQEKNESFPDLSLAIFSHYKKTQTLMWQESGVIDLGETDFNVHLNGQAYNYFSVLTQRHTPLNIISLESANERPKSFYKNKIILIGQDERQLQTLADALNSLDKTAIYYTPVYNWWLMPIIMLMMMAYLLWLLPLLSKQSGMFLGAFLILAIVCIQPVLLILEGIWWPTINLLLLLILGQLSAFIYVAGMSLLNDLTENKYAAWFQLGHYQYEKGDYDLAVSNLLKCRCRLDALDDLYEISLSYERKRQYDRALQLYSEINIRNKKYKDVEKRLNSMSGLSGSTSVISSPMQAQKTLVMPDLELPEFGRYKISKELGRGAMGVVYLGVDPKINRQVAIKTLDYTQFSTKELKSLKSRFFREAEAAGRLSHSNIVTVYDVGEEEGFAFIAMDYVSGVPLSEYTQADNLLPVAEIYRIIQVVANALDYAHQQNIVHRDIKPSNIMYDPQEKKIKITDFGIARITDSVKTRTGSFMGSPSYMAPEQMTGARVDGQADLYSLGVTFYQLLTGELPYDADNLGNLAYQIANEKHKPIKQVRADLPASATRIINKALQKKLEKRYTSGAEMAAALKRGMSET